MPQRNTRSRLVGNTGWLLMEQILRLGIGIVISVWLARYLGPTDFGFYSYAYAFAGLFTAFFTLGLDRIVVRELVSDPSSRDEILGTSITLRFASGSLTFILAFTAIVFLRPEDSLTRAMVGIIAAGFVFRAFDVIDFWFQSQVQSKYSALARSLALILIAVVKITLILNQAALISFVWAGLAEVILMTAGYAWFYRAAGMHFLAWKASLARARKLLHESWPLILSGVAVTLYMKIDQIMLGEMIGETAVGLYSAATRFSEVWYFLPVIITSTLFPMIVQSRQQNLETYLSRLRRLYKLLFWMALVVAVLISIIAQPLIDIVYGPAYTTAADVLVIHIWASIAVFLGVGSSQYLMAENLTKISFYRSALGLLANVALNLMLIPRYGGVGAAMATLISYFVSTFSLLLFRATRSQALMMLRAMIPFSLASRP